MAKSPIRDSDKFIVERGGPGNGKNYWVDGNDMKDFVPPFEPGTIMTFWQKNPPTYWSKVNTNGVHSTTRIINGSPDASVRGSRTVQQVLANIGVPLKNHTHGVSIGNHSHNNLSKVHSHGKTEAPHSHTGSGGPHSHTWASAGGAGGTPKGEMNGFKPNYRMTWKPSGSSGSANSGTVGFSVANAGLGAISVGNGASSLTINAYGTSGATMDFRVKYCDCILASKDPY